MITDEKTEQFRKQIERILDDDKGRELLGARLNLRIKNNEELKQKAVVAVLVPSNRGLHHNMMDSRSRLLQYSSQFCTIYAEPIQGSSVVSWVRNDMVANLYRQNKKFTHVLFIDDDMVFEQDVLVKMLRHDKDVVGTLYTCRTDPPQINVHIVNTQSTDARRVVSLEQEGLLNEDGLISAKGSPDTLTAGTGVLLIKREVMDRVGQMHLDCEYERKLYHLNEEQYGWISEARKGAAKRTGNYHWFEFLPRLCGYGESGEDTSFCLKAALCGFKVYVDTNIRPGHIGEYTYGFDDFLPYQEAQISLAKKQNLFF